MLPGRIITFYSYKGGTGRTMALANVAWILASSGNKVLAVDWDLEAPGLHRYFSPFLIDREMVASEGIIDFIWRLAEASITEGAPSLDDLADVTQYAINLDWDFDRRGWPQGYSDAPHLGTGGTIDIIPAGRQGPDYAARVNAFDWSNFYKRIGGAALIARAREHMRLKYDYILIDSRTGVSDTSGICTIEMPDAVVIMFTLNRQSLLGAGAIAKSIHSQRGDIELFPVPTRIDTAEHSKLQAGLRLARDMLGPFLGWLPENRRADYWAGLEMPYIPYYAYEEILAVFGDEPSRESTMLAAVERLTSVLTRGNAVRVQAIAEPVRAEVRRSYLGKSASDPAAGMREKAASPGQVEAKTLPRQIGSDYTRSSPPPRGSANLQEEYARLAKGIDFITQEDVRQIIGAMLDRLKEDAGASNVDVWVTERARDSIFLLRSYVGRADPGTQDRGGIVVATGDALGPLAWVAERSQPIWLDDIHVGGTSSMNRLTGEIIEGRYGELDRRTRGFAAVPIQYRGQLRAIMSIESTVPGRITAAHLDIMGTLAEPTGILIWKSSIFDELRLQRQSAIQDFRYVSSRLVSPLSPYRTGFLARPFEGRFDIVSEAVVKALARHRIRAMSYRAPPGGSLVVAELVSQINAAHFGIADITSLNANVLFEIGAMTASGKPLLILRERKDTESQLPFDLAGAQIFQYEVGVGQVLVYTPVIAMSLEEILERFVSGQLMANRAFLDAKEWLGS